MVFIPLIVNGQKNFKIHYKNPSFEQFIKHPTSQFKDSVSAIRYLESLRLSAINKGFVLASVDSLNYKLNEMEVFLYIGPKFNNVILTTNSSNLRFLRKNGAINEKLLSKIPFKPRDFADYLKKIQNTYLNNGYPFVSIELVENTFIDDNLYANLEISPGSVYQWNKIHVKGDSSISSKYISNLIGIRKHDVYNEKQLNQVSLRIAQLNFLQEIKPHETLFTETGSELFLYLKSIPLSSVNGVIGLQPNPNDLEKLTVTGDINLRLLNAFKRGELVDVRWKSIRPETQSIKGNLNYPFLFNTAFGIDGNFFLYKRDTTFLELKSSIGVNYSLRNGSQLKAFYQNNTSNVLSGGLNNPTFTNLGNSKTNYYGIGLKTNRLDYLPNPSKGFSVNIESSIGNRKHSPNDTTSITNSLSYKNLIDVKWYFPIRKRHVLLLANKTEIIYSPSIYENELFRFGGLTEQRGFNEDELFASTRTTSTVEYRFLLDKNSHVFLFYDQSWYEKNTKNYLNDSPVAFGTGFSFKTNIGIFSISYALGKQLDNPILIKDSKIHFGYIAYF